MIAENSFRLEMATTKIDLGFGFQSDALLSPQLTEELQKPISLWVRAGKFL
ncbi:MAG: hypothetical protein Ct9H90mP27_4120 [Gammaproteobacteria bacterium]|nr:MAG: hypothetical protein Ct9H90mP27_4120 [Gammaproteobacteria bacterium]